MPGIIKEYLRQGYYQSLNKTFQNFLNTLGSLDLSWKKESACPYQNGGDFLWAPWIPKTNALQSTNISMENHNFYPFLIVDTTSFMFVFSIVVLVFGGAFFTTRSMTGKKCGLNSAGDTKMCNVTSALIPWNYPPSRMSVTRSITLLGTNISPTKALLKMIFLFRRWDVLIPWSITFLVGNIQLIRT